MKSIFSYIIILLAAASIGAQSIDKITRRCPKPNNSLFNSVLAKPNGDIISTPCPSSSIFADGNFRLIDSAYSNGLFANLPFAIGNAVNINYTGGFAASVLDNNILGSGNGNYYVGQYTNLAVGGSGATNANIFGNLISVSNRANSVLIGSTTTIEGVDVFTNIETPTTVGYGVFAYASTGSADAVGTGTISAIHGAAGVHLGNTTLANAGEFRLFNSVSGIATTLTTGNSIRARLSNNAGNTITNFHGLSFDSFFNAGTIGAGSSIIFVDSSPNSIAGIDYFILSSSDKPTKVAGDVYVSDNTKGIILQSPDGTCYRFTVANGGALNAGVVVACP